MGLEVLVAAQGGGRRQAGGRRRQGWKGPQESPLGADVARGRALPALQQLCPPSPLGTAGLLGGAPSTICFPFSLNKLGRTWAVKSDRPGLKTPSAPTSCES